MNNYDVILILGVVALLALRSVAIRWMRHLDIKAHGWPPAHCNADGTLVGDGDDDVALDISTGALENK